jgi:hypothetical protein
MWHKNIAATKLAHSAAKTAGTACPLCQQSMPLRPALPSESAAHWECSACDAPFTGVVVKDAVIKLAHSVRFGVSEFETGDEPDLPISFRSLVKEFAESRIELATSDERRESSRKAVALDVVFRQLDEHWMPTAKPRLGIVVDLTPHGLGMITPTAIDAGHVAVQICMPAERLQLLGEVMWSRSVGHGFHNAGVRLVLRFGGNAPAIAPLVADKST